MQLPVRLAEEVQTAQQVPGSVDGESHQDFQARFPMMMPLTNRGPSRRATRARSSICAAESGASLSEAPR